MKTELIGFIKKLEFDLLELDIRRSVNKLSELIAEDFALAKTEPRLASDFPPGHTDSFMNPDISDRIACIPSIGHPFVQEYS